MIKHLATFLFLFSVFVGFASTKLKTTIHFEHNEYKICSAGKASIQAMIMSFGEGEIEKIDIIGHCSSEGDEAFNLKLSELRSKSVYQALVAEIPDYGQYELVAFGELHQVNPNQPTMNRCVEVIAYVLDPSPPKLIGDTPAAVLFPEEFALNEESREEVVNDLLAMEEAEVIDQTPVERKHLKETRTEEGTSFSVESIYFHGNSAVYKRSAQDALDELLVYMKSSKVNIRIEGHVNGDFGKRYSKQIGRSNPERIEYKDSEDLSLARANSVKRFLIENGIDPARIECVGKGGKFPVFKKPKNEKQNAANRRIEIIVLQ